jgi:hypothetical protein
LGDPPYSQSAITLRLNRLSQRRARRENWGGRLDQIRALLESDEPVESLLRLTGEEIDGIRIASKEFERGHIAAWPVEQLDLLRAIIAGAMRDGRQIVYDYSYDEKVKFTVRDDGEVLSVTFYNPPGHGR